jgi:hypothetical protein
VEQVENLIKQYSQARELYEEAKRKSNEAEAKAWALEVEVMGTLEKMGRKSFDCEGVGKVTRVMKLAYQTPKDLAEKRKLQDYIKKEYGQDVLDTMVGINYQTLNAWANKELEAKGISSIPGLDAPQAQEYIQLRKAKT